MVVLFDDGDDSSVDLQPHHARRQRNRAFVAEADETEMRLVEFGGTEPVDAGAAPTTNETDSAALKA